MNIYYSKSIAPFCFLPFLALAFLYLPAPAPSAERSAAPPYDYHAGQSPTDLAAAPVFTVEWPALAPGASQSASPASVSFLLEAPAGKSGRIGIKDGHLAYPDGRRFRIWGVNVSGSGGLPAKENAPRLAAGLARVGINCVRFHFFDRPAPSGVIDPQRNDTQALDPAAIDRLDFFIAQLKERGIYADLNLNVARAYKPGDGVPDAELLGFAKAVTFFDDRLLELQRAYARQLLSHKNPYTGAAYAQEPAVALVEFVNENSLVEAWMDGRLLGKNTRRNPGTWTDIPARYGAALTEKYNAWLRDNVAADTLRQWRAATGLAADAPIPRLAPDEFAKAAPDRFRAEAQFYLETERRFYTSMAKFLREEVGVKALLLGNSDHNHYRTGTPQLSGTALLDVVDGHIYWQHPDYTTDPATGRQTGFAIRNTPMVDDPQISNVVQLSRSAFAGKPYTVSEVNHPFPAEYACEGIPILAAYAAFQDWDGIFWYSLSQRDAITLESKVVEHFNLARDPVKMSQLPVGALLFLRGDVRPAVRTVARSYTRQQVIDSMLLGWRERPYFTPGFPLDIPLLHGVRITSLDGPATAPFTAGPGVANEPIRSDTGELAWYHGSPATGLVAVDTTGTQALIGFVGARPERLKNLSVETKTPFCAVTLSALDGQPIARSGKLLLTATARMANSGMEWNAARTSLVQWGDAPTRIEPVAATLTLDGLEGARAVTAAPLDGAGQIMAAKMEAVQRGAQWCLTLNAPALSYLITVIR